MSVSSNPPLPAMPRTPPEALGVPVRQIVMIGDHQFTIEQPGESDRLLEHPFVQSAFAADEYLPYWADLWPAARMLAKVILAEPWPPGTRVLEIGCGLGLPGVAALAMGLEVTFSDYDATALEFAANNARLNGFDRFHLLQMDWRYPPTDMQFPVVLASDLIYELRNVAPLVGILKHVLAPGGICLMTDQDRVPSHSLRETLTAQGFQFSTQPVRAGEPGGRRVKGSLYRIRHADRQE